MIETLIFYLFATILTGSSLAVISLRNPVHSVLFLILAFFNAAGIFVMLGAEFLAALLVIVYVGAVAVLFLFVVMMLNVTVESFRKGLTRYFPASFLVAVIMLVQLISLFGSKTDILVKPAKASASDITNTEALGQILYTDYVYLFQAAGLILLVAMIGAIVLTFTPRNRMRKQIINNQVARKPSDTLKVVKVETGKGVG
ncbi:MAG: NADH:ubiquinone oxidoreductase subunit J [Alphaproteobacteria bacterium CG11_big_fil_rev_8_21_14_0_20_44_7]|nr:MAG: NADH:ubiquinone oxidoreductase subunit J [Alphaproteobacteria bacterium CG11_big_fil_rev_8_21_14_0_20_44_7]